MNIKKLTILLCLLNNIFLNSAFSQSKLSVNLSNFATQGGSDEFSWRKNYSTSRRSITLAPQLEFQIERNHFQFSIGAIYLAHQVSFKLTEDLMDGLVYFSQENIYWRSFSPYVGTGYSIRDQKMNKIVITPFVSLGMHFNLNIQGGSNFYVAYAEQIITQGDKISKLDFEIGQKTSAYERTVFGVFGLKFERQYRKRITFDARFQVILDSDVHAVGALDYHISRNFTQQGDTGMLLLQTDGKRLQFGLSVGYRIF
jgi:hypothetical protein